VIPDGIFVLTLCNRQSDVNLLLSLRCAGSQRGVADMNSLHRSILTRALMTGAASVTFGMISAGGVRAEIVTALDDDGSAGEDGVNPGDNGMPGDDGESVSASAGGTQPIIAPLNKATVTGGNGGQGGDVIDDGFDSSNGGAGGNGGGANGSASTTIGSGSREADANSSGGNGGPGGNGTPLGIDGAGGNGGAANAMSGYTPKPEGRRPG
jgi:hypothetical protein